MTSRLPLLACLALAGGLLAACGADHPAAPTPTNTFSYALAAPEPSKRCPKYPASARKVVVPSTDGVHLAGAEAGSGPRGLVLLHQRDADLCGWAPYVGDLVKAGLHVLAIDMRCNGLSECSTTEAGDPFFLSLDLAADAGAAVAYLRQAGATKVAVMGASMGAATALVAAGRFPDQVDAVVALSLFSSTWNASGQTATDVHGPADAVPRIRGPILLAGGGLDASGALTGVPARLFLAAAPDRARCRIVARPDSASHGWDLLTGPDTVEPDVLAFLGANLPA